MEFKLEMSVSCHILLLLGIVELVKNEIVENQLPFEILDFKDR